MGLTCNCYDYNDNNSIMISKIESSHRNSSMNEEPEKRISKKEFNEIIFSKINTVKNNVFGNDANNTSDILTFVALFIAMFLGYYLVK